MFGNGSLGCLFFAKIIKKIINANFCAIYLEKRGQLLLNRVEFCKFAKN